MTIDNSPTEPEPTASQPTASQPTASQPTLSELALSELTASEPTVPEPTSSEIVADEVADIALDDPERAAQFVAAVSPAPPGAPPRSASPPASPVSPLDPPAASGPTVAGRVLPGAIVGVLLLQGLVKSRVKRLGLALAGSALVAAFLAGRQQ